MLIEFLVIVLSNNENLIIYQMAITAYKQEVTNKNLNKRKEKRKEFQKSSDLTLELSLCENGKFLALISLCALLLRCTKLDAPNLLRYTKGRKFVIPIKVK